MSRLIRVEIALSILLQLHKFSDKNKVVAFCISSKLVPMHANGYALSLSIRVVRNRVSSEMSTSLSAYDVIWIKIEFRPRSLPILFCTINTNWFILNAMQSIRHLFIDIFVLI